MVNIDVNKDSVEPSEDLFALRLKSLRKGNVCGDGEQRLVVDLRLDPIHQ